MLSKNSEAIRIGLDGQIGHMFRETEGSLLVIQGLAVPIATPLEIESKR